MGKIKNVIFDLGGVLVDLDRQASVDAFKAIGFPQAEELLNPYYQGGIFGDLEEGRVTPGQFYEYIDKEAGEHIEPAKIDYAFRQFLVKLPVYKLDMLLDLRRRFKLYMLSNNNPIMMPYMKKKFFTQQGLTVDDYFDELFLSFEMKMLKPHPEIFEAVLSRAGIAAEETLFIDDGEANVEAARKMGFHTYRPKPEEDFRHIFVGL